MFVGTTGQILNLLIQDLKVSGQPASGLSTGLSGTCTRTFIGLWYLSKYREI